MQLFHAANLSSKVSSYHAFIIAASLSDLGKCNHSYSENCCYHHFPSLSPWPQYQCNTPVPNNLWKLLYIVLLTCYTP